MSGSEFLCKRVECPSHFFAIISLNLCFLRNSVSVTVFPNSVMLTLLPHPGFYLYHPRACYSLYVLQLNVVFSRHLSPVTSIDADLQATWFYSLNMFKAQTIDHPQEQLPGSDMRTKILRILISKLPLPNLNLRNQTNCQCKGLILRNHI